VYALRVRLRILSLAVLITGICAAAALAAATHGLRTVRTFKLAAGKTKQFAVAYPDALEYGSATYSGTVTVLAPAASERGSKPSLRRVHVKTRGSIMGDSSYAATVQNTNSAGTAPVRVEVVATTTLPAGVGG
jgi:hypothetical protein